MEAKEIKKAGIFSKDDIHCFTDCGYNCKARVREELIAHYSAMLEDVGEGWTIRTWHNCGWHAELVHELSGFHLSDYAVRGGISEVKRYPEKSDDADRYYCHNYGDGNTHQIRAWGATPYEAIKSAFEHARLLSAAYNDIAYRLMFSK